MGMNEERKQSMYDLGYEHGENSGKKNGLIGFLLGIVLTLILNWAFATPANAQSIVSLRVPCTESNMVKSNCIPPEFLLKSVSQCEI